MKKILALLMTLALCLGLAGCNSNDDDGTPVWVEDGEDMDMGGDVEKTNPVKDPGNKEEPDSWAARIPGEYMAMRIYMGLEIPENFVLNADKTCSIWGGNYTWKIQESDENRATVEVFDGKNLVHVIYFDRTEKNYSEVYIGTVVDEYGNDDINKNVFINMSEVCVIQLTPENWQNYFEYVEVSKFWDDGGVGIYTYYQLKEEYQNVIEKYSRGAKIHYDFKRIKQKINVDLENKTYQWGDIVEIQEDPYGESHPIGNINMEGAVTIPFGFSVDMITVDKFPQDEVTRREYTPKRFSGIIVCIPAK